MQSIEAAWWLLFFCAFGLCVGSFLNVVIYRIPRDISLRNPRWSFCPGCHARIAWYDNIPLFSYIQLGARCRSCGMRIAPRYPLIEVLGALTALVLLDAFFIAHTHSGIGQYFRRESLGPVMTWQLSEDWPIYLAHVFLFAALLAMSAIDIEHYWVDVRFTWFATFAGFALHAVWSPRSDTWHRPSNGLALAGLSATFVLAITALATRRRYLTPEPPEFDEPVNQPPAFAPIFAGAPSAIDDPDAEMEADIPGAPGPPSSRAVRPALWLAVGVLLVLLGGAWIGASDVQPHLPVSMRWMPVVVLFFLLIVASGIPRRESDHAILAAIEAERHSARRVAASELLVLLPAIVIGAAAWYIAAASSAGPFVDLLAWSPTRDWQPVRGLATAAAGFVIGGGIGWFIRIVATLIMGREAFGVGDIHMMAAAGCVAGWPVVLIGFVLCSFLALLGWVLLAPFKRARAIPLGPWLSIAFLIVVLLYGPLLESQWMQNVITVFGDPAQTIHNLRTLPF
jgi:prepilin signal peptidase PulO-like enzyme (type II secretory pathway)